MSIAVSQARPRRTLGLLRRSGTALAVGLLASAQALAGPWHLARKPPMGWNSYDAYGTSITGAQFRANVRWMAKHLRRYGWRYAVIDAGWHIVSQRRVDGKVKTVMALDRYGRYVPALDRFPSAAGGAGFRPLAHFVHSLGLKFGIHINRGIPVQAVRDNLPIAGSPYRARQAANPAAPCPWSPENEGVADNAAGQAYYDSIARLYARWHVDFIKADCIASHPYAPGNIRMLAHAVRAAGRPMVISLSPGPAPLAGVALLRRDANMWRISDDMWDVWDSKTAYPQGVANQFPRLARWAPLARPGHWPDADMLAIGYLGPSPGLGSARWSRLTHAEQRTYMTLWCIARSPLFIGANLTRMNAWTLSLLDNRAVIAVDQDATDDHQVLARDRFVVWLSRPEHGGGWYLAAFNLANRPRTLKEPWRALSLPPGRYRLRNLWQGRNIGSATALRVRLAAHGTVLYRLWH